MRLILLLAALVIPPPVIGDGSFRADLATEQPRAGRPFVAYRFVIANPADVTCFGVIGHTRLTNVARGVSGHHKCTWRIPRGTAGKVLRASFLALGTNASGETTRWRSLPRSLRIRR